MPFEEANRNILIVDDDDTILKLFVKMFQSNFNLHVYSKPDDTFEILKNKEFALVISDFRMPSMTGIEFLEIVKEVSPKSRRVLMSGNLDVDIAVDSVNIAQIHSLIEKPWNNKELKDILLDEVDKYNELDKQIEQSRKNINASSVNNAEPILKTDDLLNLLLRINDSDKINDFSNQLIDALEGLRALSTMNIELFLDTKELDALNSALQRISDIEVIANQYNQRVLLIYTTLLKSFLHILSENLEEGRTNLSAVQLLMDWVDRQVVPPSLIETIENFPIQMSDPAFILQTRHIPVIEMHLRRLLSLEFDDLVIVTENLFNTIDFFKSFIQLFLIIREEVKLFGISTEEVEIDANLVSGFVSALSDFLKEVVKGTGDLNTISHEGGVILFHRYLDTTYILFTTANEVRYRIGLRQLSKLASPHIRKIPEHQEASGEVKDNLMSLFEEIFGKI